MELSLTIKTFSEWVFLGIKTGNSNLPATFLNSRIIFPIMLSLRGTLVPKQPFPHLLKYPVNTYHIHTVIIFAFFKYTFFTEGNISHNCNIIFSNGPPSLWLTYIYRAVN